ncbi:MAG: hypothetical protein WD810_01240 [Solirubrobacterales bacterium]
MSNVGRVAITCVAALLVGAHIYGTAFDLDRTGILGTVLYSTALDWAFFVLPVLTVALVNRWWALSVALVPFAVLLYLHSATDYVYPYHEDPYPVIAVMGTVFLLGISSLGFLLRAVVDRVISEAWLPRLRDKFG